MRNLIDVIDQLRDLWIKSLSDKEVQDNYVEAGNKLGDVAGSISMYEMRKYADSDNALMNWVRWELEYSMRGYRTLSLDDFIEHRKCGAPLKDLAVKREPNEKIFFHASACRQNYYKKIKPGIPRKIIDNRKGRRRE
jgi:hypothetical protein